MAHWILFCKHCGERKPRVIDVEHFLYCCKECKTAHEKEALQKRLDGMATHNPENRRSKTEGELRAMGISLRPHGSHKNDASPKRVKKERKKGIRLCGKCGQSGHNARTCGRSKKFGLRKPEEARKRNETKFVAGGKVGAPKKGKATTSKRSKARQYKCGKCGGMGHNARTCEG